MSGLSCEQAVELLMDFLKRELPPDVAQAMQHHLEQCKPCEQHAQFETRFVLIVGNRLGKEPCPDRLKDRILDSLAREREE
jgi:mycothiol system anti-sigma-R factor